jgi:DNA modification methylase
MQVVNQRIKHEETVYSNPERYRVQLYDHYAKRFTKNGDMSRALVSFQANKRKPFYRWFKYKEAFSSEMVDYFITRYRPINIAKPRILDPFAGVGTTLTTARRAGWQATGIELMPVGVAAIKARLLADTVPINSFRRQLNRFKELSLETFSGEYKYPHITITQKAFPVKTEDHLSSFIAFTDTITDTSVQQLFKFACLTILEDVSYTRKDGQYLRWDGRSGKSTDSAFRKPIIYDFKTAIVNKLQMMLDDIEQRTLLNNVPEAEILNGSCLEILPSLPENSFHLVLTSPPYCNRYDYTRTYALELAFLGYDDEAVKKLRQTLLSATVENKSKRLLLENLYKQQGQTQRYRQAMTAFRNGRALHEVLGILTRAKEKGELNNNNIPNMIENYFFEMNIVIRELARILIPGGHIVMINDNVRYHGEEVPVDLILSDYAKKAGLIVEHIGVLNQGKGNSSQQMGIYGRDELRKGVYIWAKPDQGGE